MILSNFGRSVNPRFIRGAEGTGYTHYITIQFFKLSYGSAHTDTNVKELYRNLSAFALLCSEEIGSELLVRSLVVRTKQEFLCHPEVVA